MLGDGRSSDHLRSRMGRMANFVGDMSIPVPAQQFIQGGWLRRHLTQTLRVTLGRCLPAAPVSCVVLNNSNASPKGSINAYMEADRRAPGSAGLRVLRCRLHIATGAGFGALLVAGLKAESVVCLIEMRTLAQQTYA